MTQEDDKATAVGTAIPSSSARTRRRYVQQPRGPALQTIGGPTDPLRLPLRYCPLRWMSAERKPPKLGAPFWPPLLGRPRFTTYSRTGQASSTFWLLCLILLFIAVVLHQVDLAIRSASPSSSSTTAAHGDYYLPLFAPPADTAGRSGSPAANNQIVFSAPLMMPTVATAATRMRGF